jgi:hypothetical protein
MIGALDLAVRADALCARRWQVRLRFLKIILHSLADLGIGEDSLAVLAGESPGRHAGLSPLVTDVGIPRFVYATTDAYFLGLVASGSASIVTATFAPFFSATSFPDSS